MKPQVHRHGSDAYNYLSLRYGSSGTEDAIGPPKCNMYYTRFAPAATFQLGRQWYSPCFNPQLLARKTVLSATLCCQNYSNAIKCHRSSTYQIRIRKLQNNHIESHCYDVPRKEAAKLVYHNRERPVRRSSTRCPQPEGRTPSMTSSIAANGRRRRRRLR